MRFLQPKFLALFAAFITATTQAQADIFSPVEDHQVPGGFVYDTTQPPVRDPSSLAGQKIAILASHGVQEEELSYPYEYLKRRGAQVDIVAPEWSEGRVLAVRFVKPTQWVLASKNFATAAGNQYYLILITGGSTNSNTLRKDKLALELIQNHSKNQAFVTAICSGSQVLIDAGLAKNTKLTGTASIRKDLENAGASYLDLPVVADGTIITGRGPSELRPFMETLEAALLSRSTEKTSINLEKSSKAYSALLAAAHEDDLIMTGPGTHIIRRPDNSPVPPSPRRVLDCSTMVCESKGGPGFYRSVSSGRVGTCYGGPGNYPYPCCTCD